MPTPGGMAGRTSIRARVGRVADRVDRVLDAPLDVLADGLSVDDAQDVLRGDVRIVRKLEDRCHSTPLQT